MSKNKRPNILNSIRKGISERNKVVILGIAFLAASVLYIGTLGYLKLAYAEKILPGVKIAGIDVGGKTKEEAVKIIEEKTSLLVEFNVSDGKNTEKIAAKDISLSYDLGVSIDSAFSLNKKSWNLSDLFFKNEVLAAYKVDEDKHHDQISKILAKINDQEVNSSIKFEGEELIFTDEKDGEGVEEGKLLNELNNSIQRIKPDVNVKREVLKPEITRNLLESNKVKVSDIVKEPLVLTYRSKSYTVARTQLADWIGVEKTDKLNRDSSEITVSLDKEKIRKYLKTAEADIDRYPVNATLGVKDGAVIAVVKSVDGRKLKMDESIAKIIDQFDQRKVELDVEVKKAEVNEDNIAQLGIKELISTGTSDFTGSPTNRTHNIKNGASKFNGALVKPNEEFSFNKTLGAVDASTGFLPELVIKDNKTVPEYGGGLCQVSSTAFRAALNGGYPITSRKAHAYPVGYYKPYGVDATVYVPYPDFRFTNNTKNHILIQTRVEGKKLYFDFYGTKKPYTIKFSGKEDASEAVEVVEKVNPTITNQDKKGKGSFDATFFRFFYDGPELIKKDTFVSNYDSPDKYPH